MHIKKLEICGFKSFVDRTTIHFDHDVIGVVGPNGCGKSNIVDAIRWCMGEQSPRQLRGKSMDDVIFTGSDSRHPSGFAEVTLTFANEGGEDAAGLPLEYREYPEIAVTRRLFRDGTSEYLINKTQVRLKDVTDLFLGTGVGSKAYSIVEQGKIGMIVSAKPEDRRLLIEEAAGITKYKHRKKQAEKKMELTRQNLLRVGDIVAEIDRNLGQLKRQAAKAERYIAYRKEHDDLVLYDASHKLLSIIAWEKVELAGREAAREAVARARSVLSAREGKLEAARAEALELEQRVDKAQNQAFVADNEVLTCEAEARRARDKLQTLADKERSSTADAADVASNAERLLTESASVRASLQALEQAESTEGEHARVEEARLRSLEAEQKNLEAKAVWLRNTFAASTAAAAAAQERLAGFDRRVDDMRLRRERLVLDQRRLEEDRAEAETQRGRLKDRSRDLHEQRTQMVEELAGLEKQLLAIREQLVASDKQLEAARADLSHHRGQLRALEEVHARLEGVGAGTRALMARNDPAVVGIFADLVDVPEEFIAAFAGLLGADLQTVVVTDTNRGTDLLEALRGHDTGRATIVPSSPTYVASAHGVMAPGAGVIGPIASFLRFKPEHEALVRMLTADAVVVESVAVARQLRGRGLRRTMVTMEGTVLHADGRVSGGTGDAVASGLMQQKLKIRELRGLVAEAEKRLEFALSRHGRLRDEMSTTSQRLDRVRLAEREVQMEKVASDSDLKRVEDGIATMQSRLSDIGREIDELDGKLDEAAIERDDAEQALQKARSEAARAASELEIAETELKVWAERVAAQLEVCTERKVSFARVREQATSARATVERLTRSIDELRDRASHLEREAREAARQQGLVAASLMSLRERMNDAVERAKQAHGEFDRFRGALDDARNALATHEAEIKQLRTELDGHVETERKHEMALQRLGMERDHLMAAIAERFRGLRLDRVVGDYHLRPQPTDEHRARIQELANLIDRMGPVNLEAMEEYKKTQERFEFYTTQKADLEKALDDLERAIQQMNRESKRLFRTTFDSINERFKAIFPSMFRGGRASLSLTNPDDLLETGVDILAQPPGKKVTSIELLSGGEKALTAVSLIFAIFQHKPSPFCVLDEVDAPLDEANVTRFNDMIRTMTDRSQFILITHIKRTMQSVDVLYGVTMQEPGVSRLVSVKVNQNAVPKWTTGEAEAVA